MTAILSAQKPGNPKIIIHFAMKKHKVNAEIRTKYFD